MLQRTRYKKTQRFHYLILMLIAMLITTACSSNSGPVSGWTPVESPGPVPEGLCQAIFASDCMAFESSVTLSYFDLNQDGQKEMLFCWGGGSCGAQYYALEKKEGKWVIISNWCGVDICLITVLPTMTNGYYDLTDGLFLVRYEKGFYRILEDMASQ